MSLLSDIFTTKRKDLSVDQATERVEKLRAQQAVVRADIAKATERRKALLREEDYEAEVEALEKEIARLELRLERLDEAEPIALGDLAQARDRARAAVYEQLAKELFAAERAFAVEFRGACKAFGRAIGAKQRLLDAGFATEATIFPVPPRVLDPVLIDTFEQLLFRAESVAATGLKPRASKPPALQAAPAPPASAKAPVAEPQTNIAKPTLRREVVAGKPLPPHKLAKRDPGPDENGKAVIIVLQGVAINAPFDLYEIVRLPYADALALVKGLKAEFVEPNSWSEPPREIADAFAPRLDKEDAA